MPSCLHRHGPLAVGLAFFALYAATMSPWLAHADSPEFVTLYALGGFAHPPGYPTVVLGYRAFAWLPIDPRIGAGLVTAAVGALAIALLASAARAWGAGRGVALAAACLTGLNTQVWLVHSHPEVFAFNNLFAALILWLAAPEGRFTGTARAVLLGLAGGLALGAHQSIVFVAPIGFYGLFLAFRESRRGVLSLAASGVAFAAGLGVYGYLLVTDSLVAFGRVENWDDLLHHFLRREYGTTKLAASGESGLGEQLAFFVSESVVDSAIVGFVLGLLGIARVVGTEPGAKEVPIHRKPELALVLAWLLAGPVFVALFNIAPEGPNIEIVKRFHVLPAILLGPLIAVGLARFRDLRPRTKTVAGAGVAALLVAAGIVRTQRVYDPAIEDWVLNMLRTAPEQAVVVSQGDHRYFATQYFQRVEGVRPDVVFITAVVLGQPWYVESLRDRTGLDLPLPKDLPGGARKVNLRETVDALLKSGRVVIVTRDTVPEILGEYPQVPHGVGFRLLGADEPVPDAATLAALNLELYGRFEHRASPPVYEHSLWAWSAYSSYFDVWSDIRKRCAGSEKEPCTKALGPLVERWIDEDP